MNAFKVVVLYVLLIACASSPSEAQTVYITKTGSKYHRASCQYLRKSQYPITIKEAVDRGYEPCSVCDPGSPAKTQKASPAVDPNQKKDKSVPDKAPENSSRVPQEAKSSQCTAITKAGTRCKRMTTNANGKCYQHQ